MIRNVLHNLGFSGKEIMVYMAILPIGNAPASVLAKKTGLVRSTTRYICQKLEEKGVFSSVEKNGTFIYNPEPPEKLINLIEKEEKILLDKKTQLQFVIKKIKNMINPHMTISRMKFFEGINGIIDMYEDVLRENQTIYGISQIKDKNLHPEIKKYLHKQYMPARMKLKNKSYMIYNYDNEDKKSIEEYLAFDQKVNRTTLLLPFEKFPFYICFHIYGNKLAFYSRTLEDLSGVIIDNKNMRDSQFSIFHLAWLYAQKLPENKKYKDVLLGD